MLGLDEQYDNYLINHSDDDSAHGDKVRAVLGGWADVGEIDDIEFEYGDAWWRD